METQSFFIREATQDDLKDVAHIHVRSWQQAYKDIVPQTYLDSLDVDERHQRWIKNFADAKDNHSVIKIAIVNDNPVGFISFGAGRDAGKETQGEIYAVYLLEEAWGTSVGYALFQSAKDAFKQRNLSSAYLWVLEENERAVTSYQKWGGAIDRASAKDIVIHGKPLCEIIINFAGL